MPPTSSTPISIGYSEMDNLPSRSWFEDLSTNSDKITLLVALILLFLSTFFLLCLSIKYRTLLCKYRKVKHEQKYLALEVKNQSNHHQQNQKYDPTTLNTNTNSSSLAESVNPKNYEKIEEIQPFTTPPKVSPRTLDKQIVSANNISNTLANSKKVHNVADHSNLTKEQSNLPVIQDSTSQELTNFSKSNESNDHINPFKSSNKTYRTPMPAARSGHVGTHLGTKLNFESDFDKLPESGCTSTPNKGEKEDDNNKSWANRTNNSLAGLTAYEQLESRPVRKLN